jgi:hypothetical protein
VTSSPERRIVIRRQPDGSFTVSGDQGVPAFTMFVTEGWPQLQQLTQQHQAKYHFPRKRRLPRVLRDVRPTATN